MNLTKKRISLQFGLSQPQEGDIGGLVLRFVFARCFSQRGRRAFDIQNVVNNLIQKAKILGNLIHL